MEGDVPALVGAVFAQRSEEAIAIGHHLLDSAQPLEPLRAGLERCALRGSAVRPIFTAHRLKMVHAAFQEHGSMIERRPVAARVVLLALLRFLASPVRERDPVRMAHEAVGLVEHGRLPRRLSV